MTTSEVFRGVHLEAGLGRFGLQDDVALVVASDEAQPGAGNRCTDLDASNNRFVRALT